MTISNLLIANRGEIAVRIQRTAHDMGITTVSVFPDDDQNALHALSSDTPVRLEGTGAAAYLDIEQIIDVAKQNNCDAVHPGYGFLAENHHFARACQDANIIFVGPNPNTLELFGDKLRARELALANDIPVLPASLVIADLKTATDFFDSIQPEHSMMLKAVSGGGGRGMRIIRNRTEIEDALHRGSLEANAAFGSGDMYGELMVEHALHIEVQIVGDRAGNIRHLGERDCSIQRLHQKIVEVAPSPQLPEALRRSIHEAAVHLAESAAYDNVGTFEFLVDGSNLNEDAAYYFIEANPRLQVEHTVTEEVTGLDLVRTQLGLASGQTLESLGLTATPSPRGFAIQLRINMETLKKDGLTLPQTGTLSSFRPPQGPGIRVDTFGYEGYETSSLYDSLLAKLVVHSGQGGFIDAVHRARRSLGEFVIQGVDTNLGVLMNIVDDPNVQGGGLYTGYIEANRDRMLAKRELADNPGRKNSTVALAGAQVDANDPLAVLSQGREKREQERAREIDEIEYADGIVPIRATMQSTILSLMAAPGDDVLIGQEVVVVNAMKMEHVFKAPVSGTVREVMVSEGDTVPEESVFLIIEEGTITGEAVQDEVELDLDTPRPDLAEVIRRRALTTDESRKKQVEKRHRQEGRTARENIYDLADEGSFIQYGSLAVGQALHGSVDELLDRVSTSSCAVASPPAASNIPIARAAGQRKRFIAGLPSRNNTSRTQVRRRNDTTPSITKSISWGRETVRFHELGEERPLRSWWRLVADSRAARSDGPGDEDA